MTSPHPTRFENYPTERDPLASATGESQPAPAPPPVQPYQPAPPPRPASGLSRRAVLGLAVGVPVVGILGVGLADFMTGAESVSETGSATAVASEPDGPYIDVGGEQYTAQCPDTWESLDPTGDETIVARGNNRLLALAVTDDGSRQVTDLLESLVARYRGPFRGRLGAAVDTSTGRYTRATLAATGTMAGDPARLRADLWIDGEDNGLLVIQSLTARQGSTIADESQAMADELSGSF